MMVQQIIETATTGSVGAHSIAGAPSRIGAGTKNRKTLKDYVVDYFKKTNNKLKLIPINLFKLKEDSVTYITGLNENFNLDSVLSQLSSFEKKNGGDKQDVVTYGVEDDKGNLMKVTILSSQSEDFEKYISAYLSELKNFKDQGLDLEDISLAELLYKLKDLFDIRDVEFPNIPEDIVYNADEASQSVESDDSEFDDEDFDDSEFDDEDFDDSEFDDETGFEDDESVEEYSDVEDDNSTQSILMGVIDMLKAQAKEQTARYEAEAEKARAEQAEYTARAATATLQQKEELIAMKAEKEEQKRKEKEAKAQADLATYRYKKSKGMVDDATPTFENINFSGGILRHILFEEEIITDPTLLRRNQMIELKNLQQALQQATSNEEKIAIRKQITLLPRKYNIKRQEAKANAEVKTAQRAGAQNDQLNNNQNTNTNQPQRNNEEFISVEEYTLLDEAAKRQFKRYGNKFVRKFRCYGGPKDGKMVSVAADCGIKKDPRKVRQGKKAARLKKGERVRKTKMTKRKAPSQRVTRMNKILRGDTSGD